MFGTARDSKEVQLASCYNTFQKGPAMWTRNEERVIFQKSEGERRTLSFFFVEERELKTAFLKKGPLDTFDQYLFLGI